MEVKKEAAAQGRGMPTAAQLEAIHAHAHAELKAEEVYVFSLRLCDDQVDREGERFDTAALPTLAKLFVGKTGVLDHNWSSEKQVARIFAAEVVHESDASYIKAWAYIRRSAANAEIIGDIEAGIKREVSVGCAMGRRKCSICGEELGQCGHEKGAYYDGALCCGILCDPIDAYEFSFVAVPAQREAGVIKTFGAGRASLKELAERYGAQGEYRELRKLSQLGAEYEKQLRTRAVRLCMALELGLSAPMLEAIAAKLSAQELKALSEALEQKAQRRFPPTMQLAAPARESGVESGFLV
ncbi:MAG: hypothetical protein LUH51_05780 [Firmicutes bacterium]|nr:hypothetical protein [Bacillota bacterium]